MTTDQLTELVEAHQTELFRYLKYLGANHSAAEDLVQEVYIRAFKASATPDLTNPVVRLSWLRRIGHNLFIDHCRRNTRSPIAFNSETAEHAENFWQNEFIPHDQGFACMEALEQCLRGLPERQRAMVDSFYHARQSRDQLASEFGISPDSVKMALRRIRHGLGSCIQRRLASSL
ncbi:RNA polymerase sigma factor [Haloferula chungangensis]|uniref:RNA polymerase sigma factor n=1 Tax=Haloferula chungangensis TaxID=1048331 RepID=A0ABW2L3C5_9BACT